METVLLDGLNIKNKNDLYKSIKLQLKNVEFIGNNLDALYDTLSYINRDIEFIIINSKVIIHNLGDYYKMFIETLTDLTNNYDNINLIIKS